MINFYELGIPAIVFFVIASTVLLISEFWRRNLSSTARARRKVLSSFKGEKQTKNQSNSEVSIQKGNLEGFYEDFSRKIPGIEYLELLLIRAGSDRNVIEIMVYCTSIFAMAIAILFLLHVNFTSALIIAILLGLIPIFLLLKQQVNRTIKFEEQLPDALDFISRALLSGHGLSFAFTMVGEEFSAPLGSEFKKAADEINFGLSFSDALVGLTGRVVSSDLNFFVVSMLIQRDTGGNLAELLSSISNTIRERLKLKGKVRVLASEAKLSAIILVSLPFFLALILSIINYDYIALLWRTSKGHNLLYLTTIMIPIGIFWMRKIVQIKV